MLKLLSLTAYKRHNPAAGATQGNELLRAIVIPIKQTKNQL
jgi:hypothetical protein